MSRSVCLSLLVVASLALTVTDAAVSKLPKDFKRCRRHDPALNECLKDAIQRAVSALDRGLPSLGVLPMDPLRITQLVINQGSGPVSVKLNFRDLDIIGLTSGKVTGVKADWDRYNLEVDVEFSELLRLQGLYKVNGKVLILPIQGDGKANLTLENVKATFRLIGKSLKKNGQEYMDVEKIKLDFTTQKLSMDLENLFNGDKALGKNMNLFLNQNWREILKELQPAIEEALGLTFRAITNRIFHKVPLNQIALD